MHHHSFRGTRMRFAAVYCLVCLFTIQLTIVSASDASTQPGVTSPPNDDARPNIVFIFADDWGYGDLSCHGSSFCLTPNLDQMAAEGIDFTNFTVNSPVCSPSRVAVMTGQFPARQCIHQHFAGVTSNRKRGMPDWMDPNGPSLPRLLQAAGYRTGHFGKWHLGRGASAPSEDEYGYDAFATFNGSKKNEIAKDGLASVDHAEAFIRTNKDVPFFVNLWLHEAHLAHYPQEHYLEKFRELDEQQRVYASVIAEGDEGVGRILKLLQELNLSTGTLVVFSTDNGPEATRGQNARIHQQGDPGLGGYYSVGESGGLKGRKRSLFAGGVRVPFLVRWPGVIPPGRIDRTSVITAVDLLPTFLHVAGVELPANYTPDGENVFNAFRGTPITRTRPIFWEWRGPASQEYTWPSLGVRDGRWKLVLNPDLEKVELYDVSSDWSESHDVSRLHPEVADQLTQKIMEWKATLPTAPNEACCENKKNARASKRNKHQ
ncbi:sulfatase-like hydrolase/transferase [Rhodopirellula sallentina]|uniref:N-acetylgalactosamine 6-sulfate sulfatase (GALNS) n=1 Tax=Rhodopirellula sallentina SM41 TaxID=1263870 RepID=M5UHZ4_9BACT|nr:sulfatase-like hydrolase/transferase [Rhodopirellula sallentina]EMI57466.1 N-acetylgalactosamine 6-sulfate sulfatase (GALNS) [Rhodopirellula sallentina SM41]